MSTAPDRVAIRPATSRDLQPIVELHCALANHCDDVRLDLDTVRAGTSAMLVNKQLGEVFVATIDLELVGMIESKAMFEPWWNETYWWIDNVVVRQGLQGQGIGRLLVAHVERLAHQRGVRYLRLFVNDDNVVGHNFWMRRAFVRKGYLLERRLVSGSDTDLGRTVQSGICLP